MTDITATRRRAARRLFLGSTSLALAAALAAMPARAQVAITQASGSNSLVSDQTERNARNIADGSGAHVILAVPGTISGSGATLSDNAVRAAIGGNEAVLALTDEGVDATSDTASRFSIGPAGVAADAGSVIAASQRNHGSLNGALLEGSRVALGAGDVSASALAVERNSQETAAFGNKGTASVALSGGNSVAGAGIASLQSTDGPVETTDDSSPVGARSYGQTVLGAAAVATSSLSLDNNLERAIAYGNAMSNALSVQASGLNNVGGGGLASFVPGVADGEAIVDSSYDILSSQYLGAAVKARAGHPDAGHAFVVDAASFDGSSLANSNNTLAAAGYGNQSANSVDISAASIVPRSGTEQDGGAIANVTAIQRLGEEGRVVASTGGGVVTEIAGDVAGSSISAADNSVETLAAGNRANGNLLTVGADRVGSADGRGAIGTALVGHDGTASTSGAFSVQNVQDSGQVAISAGQIDSATALRLGSAADGSSLTASGNDGSVTAVRNNATNGVTIAGTDLRTSADLNSFQVGNGSLAALLGSTANPGGAAITVSGPVTGSSLAVRGNGLTEAATGNSAANSMAITGTGIADAGGQDGAEAGMIGDGNGAAATFALANQQQLGVPETGVAIPVTSQLVGRFEVSADAAGSSLAVDDNSQQATALGSSAVNRLAIAATTLGGDGAAPPDSALSSLQFGSADLVATSAMEVASSGARPGSSVTLADNRNGASAAINQADNALTVSAAQDDGTRGDASPGSSLGPATADGDHVLGNWQVATGSAVASASTRLRVASSGGAEGSDGSIVGNSTTADAAANRALNAVSVAIVADDAPSTGLDNGQRNSAAVSATAITRASFAGDDLSGSDAFAGSSDVLRGNRTASLARGNVADNKLSLSGAAGSTLLPAVATGGTGPLVQAGAALLNVQVNAGPVAANASGSNYGSPLNGVGMPASGSELGVTGNSVSAAAYGNAASNLITVMSRGDAPGAALVNSQVNTASVAAQVTGATYRIRTGSVTGSALSLTDNQISATAVGNLATNGIAGSR